jgi:hypothetical protein
MSQAGNAIDANQTPHADLHDGTFGFSHLVNGTVTGRQAITGAGVFAQFNPKIVPGWAQVRPYAPFSYQWSTSSFRSSEANLATLGIRVFSWDLTGSDMVVEQDFRYFVWNNSQSAYHFGYATSPSWEEDQSNNVPEWDYDYGFHFGDAAPYFKTRPNRLYMVAIWCSGMCWSYSPENRPGMAIGRINVEVPLIVVGYQ